jgi:gliding motility-associated lipoprotein GldH
VKNCFGVFVLWLLFASCSTLDVYEKTVFFPEHQWKNSQQCSFSFQIQDTLSSYNIYAIIRHEDAYHFNNIWLNIATQAPGDSVKNQLVNVQLANNKKGWLGTGMDDVFDHRALITRSPVKLKKGNYLFTIQQNMREEPLQFILNAGIRVEKVKQ